MSKLQANIFSIPTTYGPQQFAKIGGGKVDYLDFSCEIGLMSTLINLLQFLHDVILDKLVNMPD